MRLPVILSVALLVGTTLPAFANGMGYGGGGGYGPGVGFGAGLVGGMVGAAISQDVQPCAAYQAIVDEDAASGVRRSLYEQDLARLNGCLYRAGR